MEKAFQSSLAKKQCPIPLECKRHYQQFFNNNIQRLQQVITQIENEREEER